MLIGADDLVTVDARRATVTANPPAAVSRRLLLPIVVANDVATAGPTMPPTVPPAATRPNRRLACARENRSAMKLQNTATNTWTKPACGGVSGSGGGKESCWGTVE